jgi:hypothetical protein
VEALLKSFREGKDAPVRPAASLAAGWERKVLAGQAAAILGHLAKPAAD